MLEPLQSKFALLSVEHALGEIFRPPPRLTVSEWADEYRELSREANAKGGKWRSLPPQIEPMNAIHAPEVQSVALQWAAQVTGKTEILINIIGFHIHQDPCPMLKIDPTLEMAEAFSKDRLSTNIRDTPALRGLVKDSRSRDSGNTILHKTFPGGHYTGAGANSPTSLAGRPIRGTLFDEIDRFPVSAGAEGDPMSLARMRSESFYNAFSISVSTPTIKGLSRIEQEMELTDKRYWNVPCPKCKKYQVLGWHQVKWPEDKPEEAYLECQHCHTKLTDAQREKMVRAGEWRPTAPFKGKRGYYLNGINVLFRAKKGFKNRLHQMAVSFLDAKKRGKESLKTWTNTFLAETWQDDAEEMHKPELIYARRENYTVPDKCVVLVAGADVQADRIECEIVGAGEGEETWGIEYRVFKGNVETWALWDELDEFLQKKFVHPSGAELQVAATCIDSGHKSKIVYSFVKRCQPRRVFAVKGIGTSGVPWVTRSRKAPVLLLKTHTAKEAIYSRLNLEQEGAGYLHFPVGYDLEYFRQLVSERVVTRFKFGNAYKAFEEHGRNEALDARVYAMAALDQLRPNYAKIGENLKLSVKKDSQSQPNSAPVVRQMQRSGIAPGWRR